MNRRHLLQLLLTGVLPGALLPACGRRGPLRLGTVPWIGYETFYLAREFHWLPPEVTVVSGASALDSLAGLRAGKLDAATLTLDEVLSSRAAGVPLCVVAVLDVSAGADQVVARADIATPAALRGRRIGVERSAVGELMLQKLLAVAALDKADVEIVNLRVEQMPGVWERGELDAAVSYEPTASRLRHLGGGVIFDSREIPDTVVDVLAVRRDRLGQIGATLTALVEAHFKGLQHLRISRQDAIHRIAAHQGANPDDVARALSGVILPDLAANRSLLATNSRLQQAAAAINQLMTAAGLLSQADRLHDLFDAQFLPSHAPALT